MIHVSRYSTKCIELKMEAITGAKHRKFTMLVSNMDVAHKAKHIIMNIVWAREEGDLEFMKEVIAKENSVRQEPWRVTLQQIYCPTCPQEN